MEDLLAAADVLVTDYSSVMFDYAVLGRPMVFFVQDLERYRDSLRGFYFDFESTAPGPLVRTTARLVAVLRDHEELCRSTADSVASFRRTFSPPDDGHAGDRVVDALVERGVLPPADLPQGPAAGTRPRDAGQPPWARRSRSAAPLARASSRRVARKAVKAALSRAASSPSPAPRMRAARRPALRAPPTDTVATGTPAGIWTMESSESRPSRCLSGTGTPMTGSEVTEASMPGRCAAPPAPATRTRRPSLLGAAAVLDHLLRHPVRRDDVDLARHAELLEHDDRRLHDGPVRVRPHDHTDECGASSRVRAHSVTTPRM